ncbi:MAG: tRNA delta(2)-isopentenylpyrophosphate transferase, tRNA dimethylallyltransferase, partial [Candidatus Parcubacteria bacterium]
FSDLNKDQPHKVDLKNKRRVIRAIEILKSLGHIPALQPELPYDVLYIGLDTSDDVLKDKIKKRINARLDQGMVAESEHLLSLGLLTHERMQKLGLEYTFISDLLKKEITLEEFREKLFFAIWHYAKRQRVWFKKNKNIHWLDVSDADMYTKAMALVDAFVK